MNAKSKQKIGKLILGLILLVVVSFVLAGCGTTKEVIVTKTEYKAVKIPETLLKPCSATAPPAKEKFKGSTDQEQKKELTDLSNSLYGDIASCNGQIKSIKDYQDKEVKNIEGAKK